MRVGEIVAELATTIRQSGRPLSPTQNHMCMVLQMLPEFVALRRVDLFEAVFPPRLDADEPQLNQVLEAVYELACHNLYTKFDAQSTLGAYSAAAGLMRAQCMNPPTAVEITDW